MGHCLSNTIGGGNHGRAASLSVQIEPELGVGINTGTENASRDDYEMTTSSTAQSNNNHSTAGSRASSIKYTDVSNTYNKYSNNGKQVDHFVTTKEIDKQLKIDARNEARIKKLLLLGSGSSGKSTLFRQLKCIHGPGFQQAEMVESKVTIRYNCVAGILMLLKKSQELFEADRQLHSDTFIDLDGQYKQIIPHIHLVLKYNNVSFEEEQKLDFAEVAQLGEAIKVLWSIKQIKRTYDKRQFYSMIENMHYFLDKVDQIFAANYRVSDEDYLKCRIRTTGAHNATYVINDVQFHIFDAGGQRSERKKWILLFDNVTAVIFVAALNHYASVLFEDENKNAMLESLQLFEEICNSKFFRRTEMILFLNKADLLRQRLKEGIALTQFFNKEKYKPKPAEYFEAYKGPNYEPNPDDEAADKESLEDAFNHSAAFIQAQYEKRNHIPYKRVFVHTTTATDKDNIQTVFWDVQNIVINSNLRKGGLV
eukprot:CAMPEP_0197025518 /NCGR_PEP_ID=MMETSP1384-20130603/5824_1 /TAXON_ID=29189 /ORGANISM="Ammonia sp." /LENGTH=480 /DNA_ID=CAMNT_0042454053 /DNA_START=64 /DNA_END=1506 /DNA_ORIENTATION=-